MRKNGELTSIPRGIFGGRSAAKRMWLFAVYRTPTVAVLLDLLWIVGRVTTS
jgi:hypothetical protein